jgi:cation transport regulator ChaC
MAQPNPADNHPVWYFAYGSNMDAGQMMDRRVRFTEARRAMIRDHALVFNRYSTTWGAGVADIVPQHGEVVEGVLYQVTEAGLKSLDRYEGVDRGLYRRAAVRVEDAEGRTYDAVCYQIVDKASVSVPPSVAYLTKLVKGAEAFGLSPAYIQKLRDRLARVRRPGAPA